jgi:hypothetical protein
MSRLPLHYFLAELRCCSVVGKHGIVALLLKAGAAAEHTPAWFSASAAAVAADAKAATLATGAAGRNDDSDEEEAASFDRRGDRRPTSRYAQSVRPPARFHSPAPPPPLLLGVR